jgi:GNAT superfamily N-acetyltransferase
VIRAAVTLADLETWAAIKNAVAPGEPVAAAELADDPSGRFYLHGEEGCAVVKPSSLARCAFTMVRVLPRSRRQGVGSALLAACSAYARSLGLDSLYGRVDADDPPSLGFVSRRGFEEIGREVAQVRELGPDEPAPANPPGIEIAEPRPGQLPDVHAVAVEATPDMALDATVEAAPYDRWLREVDGCFLQVALENGAVVGFATLAPLPARPGVLEHGLTGVRPTHRRRGIAEALKRTQLHWAAAAGYRLLVTSTQEGNEAMRSLNLKLGYRERLASIAVRGPLQ